MSSHDVREMLDLPGDGGPRPAKKPKFSAPRPVLKGLAREVQNLSGNNPIAIVPEIMTFKKRKFGVRKPPGKWEWRPFNNSARSGDPLVLHHWKKKADVVPASGAQDGSAEQAAGSEAPEDSTFAKFNVHVITPQYTDEQYNLVLQSNDWTKDETDYLMQLVQALDLRWPCIWDRYEYRAPVSHEDGELAEGAMVAPPKARTVEDIKARYYAVAAEMMKLNTDVGSMSSDQFKLLELMQSYDPVQEAIRKKFAGSSFGRTKEEEKEEESLLVEVKRILDRNRAFSKERRELFELLESPTCSPDIGIYQSTQGLSQLLHQLMSVDKTKKKKSIMGTEAVSPAPGASGPSQQANLDRRDSNIRESISGPSGGSAPSNRRGFAQPQSARRLLTADECDLYGVKRFDRITTSGPSFRHEKIKKPIINKSQTQQAKINNVLNELGVTTVIFMPTFAVAEAFESLLYGVNLLLDQKKYMDKLQGELNTALNIKAERERREKAERGEPESEADDEAEDNDEDDEDNEDKDEDKIKDKDKDGENEDEAEAEAKSESESDEDVAAAVAVALAVAETESEAEYAASEAESEAESEFDRNVKIEESEMGSASTTRKRSASVLSAASDKDAKRQKK